MPRVESNEQVTVAYPEAAANDWEQAAYCSATRRIVVVSPRPASLQSLVSELTNRCYDVMLFHRTDDPMLALLPADLWIVDRTGAEDGLLPLGSGSAPVLALTNAHAEPAAIHAGEEPLIWTGSAHAALRRVEATVAGSAPAVDAGGIASRRGGDVATAAMTRTVAASTAMAPTAGSGKLRFKDVAIDRKRMTVHREEARVDLTKTEFELLVALVEAEGGVMTRQELLDRVWGEHYFGGSNTVDVHIKSLRHKLGDDPREQRIIATVRGVGYRIAD